MFALLVQAGLPVSGSEMIDAMWGPERGGRVNAISPRPVSTALWMGAGGVPETIAREHGVDPGAVAAQAASGSVTGRFARPEEVADLVLCLASDRSANVTGANFAIDGGLISTIRPAAGADNGRMTTPVYDVIGMTYAGTRRSDERIARQIHRHLSGAASVINIGAGTGSYEPLTTILAIEPSTVMLAQRPPDTPPAVRAFAESLPIVDDAADAVMALLTIHHWTDLDAGLRELRRVTRRRIVIFTWDQSVFRDRFWLVRDYLPEAAAYDDGRAIAMDRLMESLPGARVEPIPVPHDCTDGFAAAYWRRPQAYLDPAVRAGISLLAQTDADAVRSGIARLDEDLASGWWHHRYADLLDQDVLDVGYRLVVADI